MKPAALVLVLAARAAAARGGAASNGKQLYGRYCLQVPRPERRGADGAEPDDRPVAARRRRARGRLLSPHRLHAAEAERHPAAAQPRCCSRSGRSRRSIALRRVAREGAGDADAASASAAISRRGRRSSREHCAGCHQIVARGGYVTRRGAAAARRRDRRADRRGGAHRARTSCRASRRRQITNAQLDSLDRVRAVDEAPGQPRRLVARPHRPGARRGSSRGSSPAAALVGVCLLIGRRLHE